MNELIIFDTTLRDGEQSPGASMNLEEKVRIAQALEKLKVNIIEAGFPIASPGDFASVQAVANTIKNSTVCGLARALEKDIKTAAEALKNSNSFRIHTFIATSPIHMQKKLQMNEEQVIEQAIKSVKFARNFTDDVEFSPEDAGRSEFDFLCKIIEATIKAGANTINIPDTVGYNLPQQFGSLIKNLISNIPNSDKAIFSVHCHNDLGLAVANSLSAVQNGARQVECTINGLGERAGNAALEEIVMAVKTRQDLFTVDSSIDTTQIVNCSQLVANTVGFPVQPNKAVVGANAFAHESGIHQDGVLKQRETYEIMLAQDVGWHSNTFVLGKHSGRNALKNRLEEIGISIKTPEHLAEIFSEFKKLADKKHEVYDQDLISLASEMDAVIQDDAYKMLSIKTCSATGEMSKAQLLLSVYGKEMSCQAEGVGAVDATFKAIESLLKSGISLDLYSVNNVTNGTDALGSVTVRISKKGHLINGHGTDTDIIKASAKAYLHALSRLADRVEKTHPQKL